MPGPVAPPGFLRLFVVFHESEALGAGRSVVRVLPSLAAYGWTASGWFPGAGELAHEAAPHLAWRREVEKPLRYSVRGWRSEPGLRARLRSTPAYLQSFRRALLEARPHVVHANTLRTLPEARVARSLGLPVVVHVHELPEPGPKRTLTLRLAAATADVLVAVSEAVAALLRPYARRTPVLVAHNGIAPPERHDRRVEPGTVGSVGTVCRTKGTDVFVEAAALARARAPELRFEHVGASGLDEDREFVRRLEERSTALGRPVAFGGPGPVADGLRRWELFVLASRQDAFPLATLEALAAGVPVVATSVGGLPEQIEQLVSGVLVPPERPDELADWILRLHADPALRERLGEGGRARSERFTLARQAEVLHEAYLTALNLRHGPPVVRARMRAA